MGKREEIRVKGLNEPISHYTDVVRFEKLGQIDRRHGAILGCRFTDQHLQRRFDVVRLDTLRQAGDEPSSYRNRSSLAL